MTLCGSFVSRAGASGRRRFLTGALGSAVTLAGPSRILNAAEFWNAKDPSAWSEDEIQALTSKSPWARAATPTFKGADDPTRASGGDPTDGGRGPRFRRAAATMFVRWESAQPILDALKSPLAADLAGHYVISVTNLPLAPVRPAGRGVDSAPDDALERLQNGATLQAKGKEPAEAGIARRTRIGSVLFGFSKDYLRLTATDREIFFRLDTGPFTISARFDAKEMIYHGKLAV